MSTTCCTSARHTPNATPVRFRNATGQWECDECYTLSAETPPASFFRNVTPFAYEHHMQTVAWRAGCLGAACTGCPFHAPRVAPLPLTRAQQEIHDAMMGAQSWV